MAAGNEWLLPADARPAQQARRRWAYGLSAGVLAAAAIGLALWRRPAPASHDDTRIQAQRLAPSRPRAAEVSRRSATPERAADSSSTRSGPSPPIIDEVRLEKTELCAGEETLATVRAHTVDGTDAELHYLIGPGTGQSVPLRAW